MCLHLFSVRHLLLTQQQQSCDERTPGLRDGLLSLGLHGNNRAGQGQIAGLQVLHHLVSKGTHGQRIAQTKNDLKVPLHAFQGQHS